MTIILAIHIVLMSGSLIATSAMAVVAASSRMVSPQLVRLNVAGTCTGVAAGIVMLVQQPVGAKCAALFTYVVAFAAVYAYVRRKNQLLVTSEV